MRIYDFPRNYLDRSETAYYWLLDNSGRIFLIITIAWIGLWGLLLEGQDDLDTIRLMVRGLGPELAGIVLAAVTIDSLNERRQAKERKTILLSQLGSRYRDISEMEIIELRHREWLFDGSLKKAYLLGCDLSNAFLPMADLREAFLANANLKGVNLQYAYLTEAICISSDLSNAFLLCTDLSGANLSGANLSGATLLDANLFDAFLPDANLSGINNWTLLQLEQVGSLDGAIMPDGVKLEDYESQVEGLRYDDWKVAYLIEKGGRVSDLRDIK